MASASPKPHKSRVFNAVSQKYRQFLDQCDRWSRQVRLTASRATQTLLYPVYVLLQGIKVMGQSLKGRVSQKLPQLEEFVKSEDGLKTTVPAMGLLIPVYCSLINVMGWVQTSPVAVRMNLFGESALVPVSSTEEKAIALKAAELGADIQPQTESPLNSIQTLIWAAIDYFLNYPSSQIEISGVDPSNSTALPATETVERPQLGSGLWQGMQQSSFPLFASIGLGGFLVAATLTQYLYEEESLEPVTADSEPLNFNPESNPINYLASPIGTIRFSENNADQSFETNVDISVTAEEYIKHPLVKVLEWIDQAVFLLEESFIKLWDWMMAQIKR